MNSVYGSERRVTVLLRKDHIKISMDTEGKTSVPRIEAKQSVGLVADGCSSSSTVSISSANPDLFSSGEHRLWPVVASSPSTSRPLMNLSPLYVSREQVMAGYERETSWKRWLLVAGRVDGQNFRIEIRGHPKCWSKIKKTNRTKPNDAHPKNKGLSHGPTARMVLLLTSNFARRQQKRNPPPGPPLCQETHLWTHKNLAALWCWAGYGKYGGKDNMRAFVCATHKNRRARFTGLWRRGTGVSQTFD